MKAITLWRPWPTMIFHPDPALRKPIENRTWRPPAWQIGKPMAIHAGKTWDAKAAEWLAEMFKVFLKPSRCPVGIVGVVTVARAFDQDTDTAQQRMGMTRDPLADNPHAFGPWCWVLEDATALPEPIPCSGAQGLWTPPGYVAEALSDHLEQVEHAQGFYGPDFR